MAPSVADSVKNTTNWRRIGATSLDSLETLLMCLLLLPEFSGPVKKAWLGVVQAVDVVTQKCNQNERNVVLLFIFI